MRAAKGGEALGAAVSRKADDFAAVIGDIQTERAISLRAITGQLTLLGIQTRRGGAWQVSNFRRLLARLTHPT